MTNTAGAVMAGGKSRRLGRDKALLSVNGETLLQRALRTLAEVTSRQLVVGPPERRTQAGAAMVVSDAFPDSGPLGGIYTALQAADADRVLVVACDMPFLNVELLRYLCDQTDDYDVVLPRVGGRGEQLHAVYGRACLEPIRRRLERGDLKIDRFFGEVRVRTVDEDELRRFDPELRSFHNINTTEDWAEAEALLLA